MPSNATFFRLATLSCRALAVLTLLAVGGCAATVHPRGNIPTPEALAKIAVGESTRADVTEALGSPSSTSLFDSEESWFYIGSKEEETALFPPRESERRILVIAFDKSGVISSMTSLNKEDGSVIAVVDRSTPTAGHEMTIIEQLLGTVGRFN